MHGSDWLEEVMQAGSSEFILLTRQGPGLASSVARRMPATVQWYVAS